MVKLVLIRHAQSIWNLENRFTGWADIPLSKKGLKDAKKAGELLKKFKFDEAFTSELIRAQETLFEILNINDNDNRYFRIHSKEIGRYNRFIRKNGMKYLKINVSESLNERDYGDLEGLNKDDIRKKFGDEQVKIWRRSFDVAPPGGESLKMTCDRVIPYFKKNVMKSIKEGKNVIIAAHGNSLRGVVKYLEKISNKDISSCEIENGVPYVYTFDKDMKLKSKKILK